jgi:predicted DNA-binding transcriptional regulator YafY
MPIPTILRRVRLYKLLRSGVTFSVDELAKMHHVSRRTIVRDLAALQASDERFELMGTDGVEAVRLCASAADEDES